MAPALLAVLLPALFWDRPVDTADALRKAGIERLSASPAGKSSGGNWGLQPPLSTARATRAVAPGVEYRMDVASATRVPWVDANGWRFDRDPRGRLLRCAGWGANCSRRRSIRLWRTGRHSRNAGRPATVSPHAALPGRDRPAAPPPKANIAVVDNGSDAMAEVLNLRRAITCCFISFPPPIRGTNPLIPSRSRGG